MQLGISSFTYGWAVDKSYNPEPVNQTDLVETAAGFDLKLLQIGDNLPLHKLDKSQLANLKSKLIENNILLQIGARGLTEAKLKSYIGICIELGASLLRFVIDETDYEPSVTAACDIIRTQLPLLEHSNITLALENHDRLKASELAGLVEAVNHIKVGICLDTINSIGAGESIEYIIETLAPFTVNLHLKDFGIGRLPHKQGFIIDGRIAGQGMLDVPSLIDKLKPFNRCNTAILEQWVPPEKEVKATLEKETKWAVESVQYLQQTGLFA